MIPSFTFELVSRSCQLNVAAKCTICTISHEARNFFSFGCQALSRFFKVWYSTFLVWASFGAWKKFLRHSCDCLISVPSPNPLVPKLQRPPSWWIQPCGNEFLGFNCVFQLDVYISVWLISFYTHGCKRPEIIRKATGELSSEANVN